jgi:hypothetical protein
LVFVQLERQEDLGVIRGALQIVGDGPAAPGDGRQKQHGDQAVRSARALVREVGFAHGSLAVCQRGARPIDTGAFEDSRRLERYDVLHAALALRRFTVRPEAQQAVLALQVIIEVRAGVAQRGEVAPERAHGPAETLVIELEPDGFTPEEPGDEPRDSDDSASAGVLSRG